MNLNIIPQVHMCLVKLPGIDKNELNGYFKDLCNYSIPYYIENLEREGIQKLQLDFEYKEDKQINKIKLLLNWDISKIDETVLNNLDRFWCAFGYTEYAKILKYDDLLFFLLFVLSGDAKKYFIEQLKILFNCNNIIIDITDEQSKLIDKVLYNNFFQKYLNSADFKEKIDLFIKGERGILIE